MTSREDPGIGQEQGRAGLPADIAQHLIGLDGPELRMGPELAFLLAPTLLDWWSTAKARGATSELPAQFVKAVAWLAREHERRLARGSARGTDGVTGADLHVILDSEADGLLTTSDAAQECNVSDRRIRTLCRQGEFPNAVQRGGQWLIPQADVLAYQERRPVRGQPAA